MSQLQEIFDFVAIHLLAQGEKSVENSLYGNCRYRGAEGRSCAVGCLISDEAYSPEFEGRTVRTQEVRKALEASGIVVKPDSSIEWLLDRLQTLHDSRTVRNWVDGLLEIAAAHNLSAAVLGEK